MALFSISGLASGIDTRRLIQELMAIERRPVVRLQARKDALAGLKDSWTTVKTKLVSVQAALDALRLDSVWGAKTATSSDEAVLTASATSSAAEATYSITVSQLAQAHKVRGSRFASTTTALWYEGTFDITVDGATKSVSVVKSDTLAGIRDKINNAGAGVTASIVDGCLVIQADHTGARYAISFTDSTAGAARTVYYDPADQSVLTATASDLATEANYTVNVLQVAQAQQNAGDWKTDTDPAGFTSGAYSFDITQGGTPTTITVNLAGTETNRQVLDAIKTKIDEAGFGNITATVESSGGQSRLVLSSTPTGAAYAFTVQSTALSQWAGVDTVDQAAQDARFTVNGGATLTSSDNTVTDGESGMTGVTLTLAGNGQVDLYVRYAGVLKGLGILNGSDAIANQVAAAQDAGFTVDGVTVTRSTNTIDDVVTGVTLYLEGTSATAVELRIARDAAVPRAKIEAFVSAYNDFMTTLNGYVARDGRLEADPTAARLQAALRKAASSKAGGIADSELNELVDLGIKTSDTSGLLAVDTAALDALLAARPDQVKKVFYDASDGVRGVGEIVRDTVDLYVNSGGIIPERVDSYDRRSKDLEQMIDAWENRLAIRERNLVRQFTTMEQALSQLQAQGNLLALRLQALFQNQRSTF